MAARTSRMKAGSAASRTAMSTYSRSALRHRLRHAEVREDRERRPLAVALADERHDRHAHVERLQRAVDAAEGHRVEHEVDQLVARLVLRVVAPLRQEEEPVGRDARRRGEPRHTSRGTPDSPARKTSRARGMRSSTSRQSPRQRRDSLSGVTNAPIRIASAATAERRAVERMRRRRRRRADTDRRSRPSAAASRSGTPDFPRRPRGDRSA